MNNESSPESLVAADMERISRVSETLCNQSSICFHDTQLHSVPFPNEITAIKAWSKQLYVSSRGQVYTISLAENSEFSIVDSKLSSIPLDESHVLLISPDFFLFISRPPLTSSFLYGHPVRQVACGKEHTLCLTADTNEVFSWGRGSPALGLGPDFCSPEINVERPCLVDKCCLPDGTSSVVLQIAAGDFHSIALVAKANHSSTKDSNSFASLELPSRSTLDLENTAETDDVDDPLAIKYPGQNSILAHETQLPSVIIPKKGVKILTPPKLTSPSAGSPSFSPRPKLMHFPSPLAVSVPSHLSESSRFVDSSPPNNPPSTNRTKSSSADDLGRDMMEYPDIEDKLLTRSVLVWGSNSCGELGLNDYGMRCWPVLLQCMSTPVARFGCPLKVACGSRHSMLLTSDSQVYAWGNNKEGQIQSHDEQDDDNATSSHIPSFSVPVQMNIPNIYQLWDIQANGCRSMVFGYVLERPIILCFGDGTTSQHHPEASTTPYLIDLHNNTFAWCQWSDLSRIQRVLRAFCCHEKNMIPQLGRLVFSLITSVFNSELRDNLGHTHPGSSFLVVLSFFQKMYYRMISNVLCATRCLQQRERVSQFGRAFLNSYLPIVDMYSDWLTTFVTQDGVALLCGNYPSFFDSLECDLQGIRKEPEKKLNEILLAPLKHLEKYRDLFEVACTSEPIPLSGESAQNSEENKLDEPLADEEDVACLRKIHKQVTLSIEKHRNLMAKSENTLKVTKKLKNTDLIKEFKRRRWYVMLSSDEIPLSTQKNGKVNGKQMFILCEDCFLVVNSEKEWTAYNLRLLWLQHRPDLVHGFCVLNPEESITLYSTDENNKMIWARAISSALSKLCLQHNPQRLSEARKASIHWDDSWKRTGNYTFKAKGPWEKCIYEGQWLKGKVDGRGVLKWSDGAVYDGEFRNGDIEGFGTKKSNLEGGFTREVTGHWKQGKVHGYADLSTKPYGEQYRGTFHMDKRQGHGMEDITVSRNKTERIYIGEWLDGRRHGYGVEEIVNQSEKYFGQWQRDKRTGYGTLVTVPANYYEGYFEKGKLNGEGILDVGDGNVYEGEIIDFQMRGKGTLFMHSGDQLVGTFSGTNENGSIRFNGTVTSAVRTDPKSKGPRIGYYATCDAFPVGRCCYQLTERLFSQLLGVPAVESSGGEFTRSSSYTGRKDSYMVAEEALGSSWNRQNSLTPIEEGGLSALVRAEYSLEESCKAWDRLCSIIARRNVKNAWRDECQLPESLCRVPNLQLPGTGGGFQRQHLHVIREYLCDAFRHPRHPLYQYLVSLQDVFENTFAGIGVHERLLPRAMDQLRLMQYRLYALARLLFPCLPPENMPALVCDSLEDWQDSIHMMDDVERPNSKCFNFTAQSFTNSLLLPKLHSSLFTLFALRHQQMDNLYSQELRRLNRMGDLVLMNHLEVDSRVHGFHHNPANDMDASPLTWVSPFTELADVFARLNTFYTPDEKLLLMEDCSDQLTQILSRVRPGLTPATDDILPLLVFVCVRAKVPNLGAELDYVKQLWGEIQLCHGKSGVTFTNFQAAYYVIAGRTPDIR